jgi:hypothetical protein
MRSKRERRKQGWMSQGSQLLLQDPASCNLSFYLIQDEFAGFLCKGIANRPCFPSVCFFVIRNVDLDLVLSFFDSFVGYQSSSLMVVLLQLQY